MVAIILLFVMLAALFVCMMKEKNIVGIYKANHVFGRGYALFAVDLIVGGIGAPISNIILGTASAQGISTAGMVVMGLIMAAIGVFMYKKAYDKCPDSLKSSCCKDLTIVGLGVLLRVSLFFMMFIAKSWWEFNKVEEYRLDNGLEVYVDQSGTVYDFSQNRQGTLIQENGKQTVVWKNL